MKKPILLNYLEYRAAVIAEIEKRIGGKPKFVPDEMAIEYSFSRGHHLSVPARCAIEDAIEEAKKS